MTAVRPSEVLVGWAVLLLSAPLLLLIPVTNDSAWQMWLGRQMLHGANLYTDLVEVNPPLWFWMAVPLAWISEAFALPSRTVLIAFLLTAIALSYWLCTALTRDWPERRRWAFTIGFLLATIPIALRIFTQREHFVLVATIPYVLLCHARNDGKTVPPALAIAVAALAALGFAIKPFFALVPIALELWLWRTAPRIRPETITVGMLAAAYVGAVAIFEQDFLRDIPAIAAAYAHFTGGNYTGFVTPFLLFCLAFFPLSGSARQPSPFLVAGLAFLLAFSMQGKGWSYQALPALGMLVLALSVTDIGRSAVRDAVAIGIVAVLLWTNARTYPTERAFIFPNGTRVATLSVSSRPDWPQAEERGYLFPLHTISLWQLPAVEAKVLPAAPLQGRIAGDLRCNPPLFLVVDQDPAVLNFVKSGPELAAVLSHYRPRLRKDGLLLYRQSTPFTDKPTGCRRVYTAK